MKYNLIVGKYTLESLTNGMYASPFDLYREYIQNAVDSFDEYDNLNLKKEEFKIDVILDTEKRQITIRDNGCGIKQNEAASTLLDIGNSKKDRAVSRGFRGIGRLAGLGYCSELKFTTSYAGENKKTVITFNASRLKELLVESNKDGMSLQEVLDNIVEVSIQPEKEAKHYFEVNLNDVDMADHLLDQIKVKEYLIEHCPLPYSENFKWASVIKNKVKMLGYVIKEYPLNLIIDNVGEMLYKPYRDTIIADRVKRIEDNIQDVEIVPFYNDNKLSAILWYAKTNFYGTIIDNLVKGIRLRQGNIAIGGHLTCNQFFKEERFNGWIIGEMFIADPDLVINSRRDNFEKNRRYYDFSKDVEQWSMTLSKDIRKKSYDRSLSNEKKLIIEEDVVDDENCLCSENLEFVENYSEASVMEESDSDILAEDDLFSKLSMILNNQNCQTKYSVLNLNNNLNGEQKKILEKIFDIIGDEYDETTQKEFINTILKRF